MASDRTSFSTDTRTAAALLQQWRNLQTVKNALIKEGHLTGDASPDQVVAKLREILPAGDFVRQPPSARRSA